MILPDEGDEIPHILKSGQYEMHPTHIGDFNYDYKVDMKDIRRVAKAFGSYPGHPIGTLYATPTTTTK